MRTSYKWLSALLVCVSLCCGLSAQQDAMFTKYMFNQLAYNPAYAGSYDFMSINAIYRNQWWGIEGAPETQSFTIHSPIVDRMGLGLSVVNDKIGATGSTSLNLAYAYHVPFKRGKLGLAIQGGIMNWRANFNKLDIREFDDPAFENMTPNMWLPNVGAGVYYYAKRFYVGASVPHIINNDLRSNDDSSVTKWARQYRHYYFMAGGLVDVTPNIKFRPSMLVKNVGLFGEFNSNPDALNYVGAPTEFDLDLSLMFYDALWVGTSFRSAFEGFTGRSSFDSADIWVNYLFKNGLRVGAAYDYTLTKLQQPAQGSFEVMVGYDFFRKEKKIVTPRYF